MTYRKKLIEVALPLDAINEASINEGFIYKGNPSAVHKWWAQRPLAACRAVLFSSLVDDPGEPGAPADYLAKVDELPPPSPLPTGYRDMDEAEKRRQKLFRFIGGTITRTKQGKEKYTGGLVQWESSNDERILATARELIRLSCEGNPPPVLDPFCGGGSIPLEAQRLGLEAHASDLNPVAVLITKALIEIPPKYAGMAPVNPDDRAKLGASAAWKGAAGLAADVRYYGKWMRDEAEKRIGHLYPKARLPDGTEATVIAWLWARTVPSPAPHLAGVEVPLVRTFALSTKKGGESWVEPVTTDDGRGYRFVVHKGKCPPQWEAGTRAGQKATFKCLLSDVPLSAPYIREQGKSGNIGERLMAVVAEGKGGRVYLDPASAPVPPVARPQTDWLAQDMPDNPRWFSPPVYGLRTFADLFTPRQLVALTTFSDLVGEARERVLHDALAAGLPADTPSLADGGTGAHAYADAVATYLAFALDKSAEYTCSLVPWYQKESRPKGVFARQALPMVWDFAEVNPLGAIGGTYVASARIVADSLELPHSSKAARVLAQDVLAVESRAGSVIATDPPYYDNIGYSDLSDFFYVWLRRSLGSVHPELFRLVLTPKTQELVSSPYRFEGGQPEAERFFRDGLLRAFEKFRGLQPDQFPLTLFYAFKQSDEQPGRDDENVDSATSSTGWETMLQSLDDSGFSITGTVPLRTERSARAVSQGTNALASSIVLVCRPRPADAPRATRREFVSALSREIAPAVKQLKQGGIAPVDLGQAAIGPGMAVFSRYSAVLDAGDKPMSVRTALQLINKQLDEVLSETEGDFDADTRWALTWFEGRGLKEGPYGEAETLSTRFAVSVDGLRRAGLLESGGGKVRLYSRDELPGDWDPRTDTRLTTWEVTQYLVRALLNEGEEAAAAILVAAGPAADPARDLAYRLFALCERKGWSQEAGPYNALAVAWPRLAQLAANLPAAPEQRRLV